MPSRLPIGDPARLPIAHPDYRYPASKNPYWAKLNEVSECVVFDHETENHQERWRAKIGVKPSAPLHVEIGCNAAHVVAEWASRNPSSAYIGIDWKIKAIYRGAEKIQKRGLKNLQLLKAHASRVQFMFGPEEIDYLYLFFPDPWPKKAQWKHRFVTPATLRAIAPLLKHGGVFHIKTDHAGYFEWMEEAVAACSDIWRVSERSTDLHAGNPAPDQLTIPEVTLFERIFIRDGIKINSLKLVRR